MTPLLSEHEFGQRRARVIAALDDLGELDVLDTGRAESTRVLRMTTWIPDGENVIATIDLSEVFERSSGSWQLTEYTYELNLQPGPGRRAFHYHEDLEYHFHCVDPASPDKDHHYRGHEVDPLEAFTVFAALIARGAISCDELVPLPR